MNPSFAVEKRTPGVNVGELAGRCTTPTLAAKTCRVGAATVEGLPVFGAGARVTPRKVLHDPMEIEDNSLRWRSATLSVAFMFSGVSAYVLMVAAKRSMSPLEFSNFTVFWSFGFFLAAAVGVPIEQELTRGVAHSDAKEESYSGDVWATAKVAARLACGALVLGVAVAATGLLKGYYISVVTVVALACLIVGEVTTTIIRGILSGTRSTSVVASLIVLQSTVRTCLLIGVLAVDVRSDVAALAVGISSLTCLAFIGRARARMAISYPVNKTSMGGVSSRAILRLVGAAPFNAVFSVGTPALASLVAKQSERAVIGDVLAALSLTSAPVLIAAALQSVLLPSFVRSIVEGGPSVVHRTTRVIVVVVMGLSCVAAAAAAVVGEKTLIMLFGPTPGVGRLPLVLMTFAAGLLFLSNLLAPVCIALRSHGAVTQAWATGALTMVAMLWIPGHPLAHRLSVALVAGSGVVVVSLTTSLRGARKRHEKLDRPRPTADEPESVPRRQP